MNQDTKQKSRLDIRKKSRGEGREGKKKEEEGRGRKKRGGGHVIAQ